MIYQHNFHLQRMRVLLLGSAAAIVAGAAAAQDNQFVYELDPIVVEARDAFVGAADRATTMYVSDFELERARTGDLKDVFAGIASVSVGGALPLTQKIYMNGVDMLNLGVTIDGAAQNNRAFHHVTANAIDPGLLKQVRADATISPADAGPYALAGSVVFETVDPEDVVASGQSLGGNLRLSYSDNGGTRQGALTVAGVQEGFSWLGYVKRADGDDYESGNGTTVLGTEANLTSYLGKIAYESGEGHRFELSGQQLKDKELRQFRANFGGLSGVTDSLRVYDTTRSSYSFSYENVLANGMWDPKFTLGYSESDIVVPEPYDSNGLSGTWSASLQNTFNLSEHDTIVAGIDYQKRFGNYTSPTYSTDIREESRNVGVFAQARLEPTDRLSVSFGGRFDQQEFTGIDGKQLTNSGISGNVSATFAVTDAFSVRGGISSVFGGIDIEDNYTYRTTWNYDALEASRAKNATLGFDWNIGNLGLGGELFVTQIENGRGGVSNFDFESRGFNLGATYGWATGFARTTLSHSDVKVNDLAADAYTALDFGAPLGTVVAVEVEQETGLAGLRIGGGFDVALDYSSAGDTDFEGYQIANVFAEYVPPSMTDFTIRAEISNLFDKDFADRATYGAEFASVTTLQEPGRTISLIAVARF
ncbi:TonB-dependent receptor plug domain-containing protein [Puniceibacterium sediminis]|uniref:Hemoglobin/transferrin/lactoferrin receptor protein n=1 Tax=Puniceibacterium sediminis TaxID=1608407 RepID=A0A238ZQX9_9RHOB|nr:TonB-dependent receptor [Puniceibacterium sediminis]SNR85775.1 hemoglobin/transferrin/lactoferrin receptor protein [Puniceibacterium sediminis]